MRALNLRLPLALLVAGILLGPAYYVWCIYFSGRPIQETQLERASGGTGFAPVLLRLTPAMTPVRLTVTTTLLPAPRAITTAANRYRASLKRGGAVVVEQEIRLTPRRSRDLGVDAQAVAIGQVAPEQADDYIFQLIELGEPAWPVSAITLNVRGNVREPVPTVLGVGVALIVVALSWLFVRRRS